MNQPLGALKAPLLAFLASLCLLTDCGPKTLEFRNAQIVNGKVYRAGSDEPFSGHVTNVPQRTVLLRHQAYEPFAQTVYNVFQALQLSVPLFAGQIHCDVDSDDGILDGRGVCRGNPDGFLAHEMRFKQGTLDGRFKHYDPNKEDRVLAEATFDKGLLDGEMKIYGPQTGRQVFEVLWKDGKPEGRAEIRDEKTGKLFSRAFYRNGLKDGIAETYDLSSGKLKERSEWKLGKLHGDVIGAKLDSNNNATDELRVVAKYDNGVEVPLKEAVPSLSSTDVQRCVEVQTTIFRVQQSGDEPITADQLGEWEAECRSGKRPN